MRKAMQQGASPAPAAQQSAPADKMAPATKSAPGSAQAPSAQVPIGSSRAADEPKGPRQSQETTGQGSQSETTGQGSPSASPPIRDVTPKAESPAGKSDASKAESGKSESSKSGTTGQGAASTSASLTGEQRTKISASLRQRNAPRVTKVNFNISIGTAVPRDLRRAALPVDGHRGLSGLARL